MTTKGRAGKPPQGSPYTLQPPNRTNAEPKRRAMTNSWTQKKPTTISRKGFIHGVFWLLDLGSNQGPTD